MAQSIRFFYPRQGQRWDDAAIAADGDVEFIPSLYRLNIDKGLIPPIWFDTEPVIVPVVERVTRSRAIPKAPWVD